MADVLIVMGSDSDLPSMKGAAEVLKELGISFELTIVSAHRTPERLADYGRTAAKKGFKVIIAGAGGAAHLPGMLASFSSLPVVGVPVKSSNLSGVDSLYSIVQMPPGVPVGTMAINGSVNAGLFAAQIIGASDTKIRAKIDKYKKNLEKSVLDKAKKIEKQGFDAYLKTMEK
ncbi:MAG: 5-(carboxyamino)imidazole ribonucleotide mutase [Bacteroidetes bacterium]|nr:5-(carboxyamino)imidazole ribonucleotide mutase [Bacteroidota bacterium]